MAVLASDGRRALPEDAIDARPVRRAADGTDRGLSSRVVALDPLTQVITLELRARRWRDGQLEADERYTIKRPCTFTTRSF